MARCGITDLPGNINTTTVTNQNMGQSLLWYRQLWSLKLLSARGPLRQKILSQCFINSSVLAQPWSTSGHELLMNLFSFSNSPSHTEEESWPAAVFHRSTISWGCTSCPSKKPAAFQVRVQNTLYRSRDTIFALVKVSSGRQERQWANSLNVLDVHTSMQETQEIN